MDSVSCSDEGDWAERKELEKNETYTLHRYFINYLSAPKGKPWNCSQINFTVGARGSLKFTQFQDSEASPLEGNEFESQRQNSSTYGIKNASLV